MITLLLLTIVSLIISLIYIVISSDAKMKSIDSDTELVNAAQYAELIGDTAEFKRIEAILFARIK